MKPLDNPIAGLLKRLNGVDISLYDDAFLNRSLQRRAEETHCETMDQYGTLLEQSKAERETFINSLQIHYSEFFRNPLTFAVLEKIILPLILQKKEHSSHREIRIWSSACAAGQEAYSLAMLLEEMKKTTQYPFNYRIFATDRSGPVVEEARQGHFFEDTIRNVNLKRINAWFTENGPIYMVKQELKENIDFSVFDLFNEQLSSPPSSIFGGFDLVLCANLLFYYKKEYRDMILEKAGKSSAKGGYLVTGEAERDIVLNHRYQEVYPQSGIFRMNQ